MLSVGISATCHIAMNKRRINCFCFLFAILINVIAVCFTMLYERNTCAGVRILTRTEYAEVSEANKIEGVVSLLQNALPVPMDTQTKTIYISIDIKEVEYPWRFSAVLSSGSPKHKLYFAPDSCFLNMENAVKEGHPFKMLAVSDGQIEEFSVVFTTLPVLELSAEYRYKSEGEYRHHGLLTLTDPYTFHNGEYSVAHTQAEWHVRGRTTSVEEKPPYKITLKKEESNENKNLSLLQLGADDDWILNSMIMDDVKIREMTISNLWNSLQDAENSSLKMSKGEYVEVIIDGEYKGLHMLQRRVDNKYLGEKHSTDIIVKGNPPYYPESPEEAWRIQYNPSNISLEEVAVFLDPLYRLLSHDDSPEQFQNTTDMFDIDNMVDVNVFMSAFHMVDNDKYNNMNYLLHKESDQFILEYVPWDVDMCMGLAWNAEEGFHVNMDQMHASAPCLRKETRKLLNIDSELKAKLGLRWKQLRETTLSLKSIEGTIYSCYDYLERSGALVRDKEKWGLHYRGEDTLAGLLSNLRFHLSRMDDYYTGLLNGEE